VIQADGGTGGIDHRRLRGARGSRAELARPGIIKTDPIKDSVAAVSIGIIDGKILLDLCYEEDSCADVDMNFVMTGSGKFIEVQATAEHVPFDDFQMTEMLALARAGVTQLMDLQRSLVKLS
jgi:ribonuclease PH